MKELICTLLLLVAHGAMAQLGQYPNMDFEDWTIEDSIVTLEDWQSTEGFAPESAYRITDAQHLSYAQHLETVVDADTDDTIPGFLAYGSFDADGEFFAAEYTSNVDSIIAWLRWDMMPNDTGSFICAQIVNGNPQPIFNAIQITGASNGWTRVAVNCISPSQDSIQIAFSTENFFGDNAPIPGSVIEVDNVFFVHGTSTPDPLPNQSFENYTVTDIEDPAFFGTTNGLLQGFGFSANVTKSTDAYEGNFSAFMEPNVDAQIPGGIFTAELDNNGDLTGGEPFTAQPDSLIGWYKSNSTLDDSSVILVEFYENGNLISDAFMNFDNASTWTRFALNLDVPVAPDTILILMLSGENASAFLAVDAFEFKGGNVGIEENEAFDYSMYPNPTVEWLNLSSKVPMTSVQIYDLNGRLVQSSKATGKIKYLNVANLERGQYLIEVTAQNGQSSTQTMVKE